MLPLLTRIDTVLIQFYMDYCSLSTLLTINSFLSSTKVACHSCIGTPNTERPLQEEGKLKFLIYCEADLRN